MKYKKFGKMDFKKLYPAGWGPIKNCRGYYGYRRLIPFVNENMEVSKALKILSQKKLGILIVINKNKTLEL